MLFDASPLNDELQIACIKDFALLDINKDGLMDFFYGGNHFSVEPETVRYDAGGIGLCINQGNGKFNTVEALNLGTYLNDDVRYLEILDTPNGTFLMVSINNGPLLSFRIEFTNVH